MNERTKQFFLQNKSLLEKQGLDELYDAAIRSKTVRTSDITEALIEAGIDPMLQVSKIYDMMYFNIYSIPTDVTIPSNIDFIGNQAFTNTMLQKIDCNNVNYIDVQAFYRCLDLQEVKIPNVTGRTNWNYVKTIDANILGDIPQEDMQKLKDIFNSGVTFWHNPNTFLDYSQSNN